MFDDLEVSDAPPQEAVEGEYTDPDDQDDEEGSTAEEAAELLSK